MRRVRPVAAVLPCPVAAVPRGVQVDAVFDGEPVQFPASWLLLFPLPFGSPLRFRLRRRSRLRPLGPTLGGQFGGELGSRARSRFGSGSGFGFGTCSRSRRAMRRAAALSGRRIRWFAPRLVAGINSSRVHDSKMAGTGATHRAAPASHGATPGQSRDPPPRLTGQGRPVVVASAPARPTVSRTSPTGQSSEREAGACPDAARFRPDAHDSCGRHVDPHGCQQHAQCQGAQSRVQHGFRFSEAVHGVSSVCTWRLETVVQKS